MTVPDTTGKPALNDSSPEGVRISNWTRATGTIPGKRVPAAR